MSPTTPIGPPIPPPIPPGFQFTPLPEWPRTLEFVRDVLAHGIVPTQEWPRYPNGDPWPVPSPQWRHPRPHPSRRTEAWLVWSAPEWAGYTSAPCPWCGIAVDKGKLHHCPMYGQVQPRA
jgi:hypothetical protein